ncbi:hypothetical protein AX768_26110 [Burkholderia sp. PAMC 28687]|uniref:DUF3429 domain-containing protein n=1 Tax=Burkholderia sp. PAMC 28687 TaxID=1795874 RepID=UPI0007849963|nr:DUF3429 domain-containing protein [Burkholderia sp. PAMC 28687]AMM17652.1 hypothetical protein AX768_26110 [Burkholderia sp. PAMC 28687]
MTTLEANTPLPKLLGYGGAIPFIGLALLVHMLANHQDVMRHALLGYGACIVSFVGAVHWGIWLATNGKRAAGILWSVVPSIAAWVVLSVNDRLSCLAMAAVLVSCLIADFRFRQLGDLPQWYVRMRITLTTVGALSLIAGTFGA